MNLYQEYIEEIEVRKGQGLSSKPIDDGELLAVIIKMQVFGGRGNPHGEHMFWCLAVPIIFFLETFFIVSFRQMNGELERKG